MRAGLEVGDPAPDLQVVDENADDVGVIGRDVTREGGKEQLLLEAEVLAALLVPEVERRVLDRLCV